MPPKKKDFLKPNPKAKQKPQEPQSENDFLELADEHEQAAGKWKAGDAAKATRFFNRAIDAYNTGLQRFPKSFDLAYNKANLEYTMSEDDRIVAHLGSSKAALLEETLKSHRLALSLDPENTDINFNTAQVLTSLAEEITESFSSVSSKLQARKLLEEAVDKFTGCLASQQKEYEEMQAELAQAQTSQQEPVSDPGSARQDLENMETASTTSSGPEQWATVIEPVTPSTILETCTAQLNALSALLGLYDPAEFDNIQLALNSGLSTVQSKIPATISQLSSNPFPVAEETTSGPTLSISSTSTEDAKTSPKAEALLAAATFQASVAEYTYRANRLPASTYAQTISETFTPLTQESPENSSAVLNNRSAYADALLDLASSISDSPSYETAPQADVDIQWTALTQAQTLLTQLSTQTAVLSPSRLAAVFLGRGDVESFRFRLATSTSPAAKPAWAKSKNVLVANAGVYYRGARSYAERAGALDVHKTADAKALVAEVLKAVSAGEDVMGKKAEWKGRGKDVVRVLEQMVDEGILRKEDGEGVLSVLQ